LPDRLADPSQGKKIALVAIPRVFWPISLTTFRLLLGPFMVWLASRWAGSGPWLVVLLYAAILSDIFDGIVARRLGVATPGLRRFDSQTDLVFWLCVLGCVWSLHPAIVRANLGYIVAMLGLEAGTYTLSFLKFGREHSTHAYLSKVWGLILVGAFTAILGFGEGKVAFPVLFYSDLISGLDVIAIILILPRWQSDVPSCYHATLIRRGVPFRKHPFFH
jgi:phosphatidylglycerophosphate synthase